MIQMRPVIYQCCFVSEDNQENGMLTINIGLIAGLVVGGVIVVAVVICGGVLLAVSYELPLSLFLCRHDNRGQYV